MNSAPGVAYADELTVCAAIAQEFLAARYVSGSWLDGSPSGLIKEGQRYFKIERELKYPDTGNRADFRVERIDRETDSIVGAPTLIEAKRAFRWSTKLGDVTSKPVSLHSEIIDDIHKLQKAAKSEIEVGRRLRGYILVWNVQEKGGPTDLGPKQYFDDIPKLKGVLWQIRMYPLSVFDQIPDTTQNQLNRWLWVILAEVTELGDEDLLP